MHTFQEYRKLFPVFFAATIVSLNCISVFCQNIVPARSTNEKIYLVRTKQFNEFLDRFNYKTDFNGNIINSDFSSKVSREKMIEILFDLKDPRTDPMNKSYSSDYTETKGEFIKEVVRKNLLVNKYSVNIIAEAKSSIIYKGIPQTISIFLNQELVGKDMVKWVLTDVKGDILNIFKSDTSLIRFIPPSSNETDFLNMKRAFDDIDHLQDYAYKDFRPDYLSVFFYCLNTGLIKFEYVEKVLYHIIDIPGWCIKVMEFNRADVNSGWLISDVTHNKLSLTDYLKSYIQ
jgi:hypothetical protein